MPELVCCVCLTYPIDPDNVRKVKSGDRRVEIDEKNQGPVNDIQAAFRHIEEMRYELSCTCYIVNPNDVDMVVQLIREGKLPNPMCAIHYCPTDQ